MLELGLGNGRTYDHLRMLLPDREIFVFDRQLAAHPDCIPPEPYLILGDLAETLVAVATRLPAPAALAHADLGRGDETADRALTAAVARDLPPLMAPGGIILSDQGLDSHACVPLVLPTSVPAGRYFLYRRT